MTEAKFSFTTKIAGDLFTIRGDTFEEFTKHAVEAGAVRGVGTLLAALNGDAVAAVEQDAFMTLSNTLGATPVDPFGGSFAPAAPPAGYVSPQPATPVASNERYCQHGPMVKRAGNGAKGEWKAWFCPTPKDTPGQCKPIFAEKKNPAEWNTF